MQVEVVTRLMEQVCNRINLNPNKYLPKVGQAIIDVKDLKNEFDR